MFLELTRCCVYNKYVHHTKILSLYKTVDSLPEKPEEQRMEQFNKVYDFDYEYIKRIYFLFYKTSNV